LEKKVRPFGLSETKILVGIGVKYGTFVQNVPGKQITTKLFYFRGLAALREIKTAENNGIVSARKI